MGGSEGGEGFTLPDTYHPLHITAIGSTKKITGAQDVLRYYLDGII